MGRSDGFSRFMRIFLCWGLCWLVSDFLLEGMMIFCGIGDRILEEMLINYSKVLFLMRMD